MSSASQEIPHVLWQPKVHYRFAQQPTFHPCPEAEQALVDTQECVHVTYKDVEYLFTICVTARHVSDLQVHPQDVELSNIL